MLNQTISSLAYRQQMEELAQRRDQAQATEAEATEFNIKTLEEYLHEIRKAITAVRPAIQFTFNGAGRADAALPKRARLVDDQADWLSIEGHRRDRTRRPKRPLRQCDSADLRKAQEGWTQKLDHTEKGR